MSVIWITGGKGFIGRHAAKFIAGQNHNVFGIGHGLWAKEDASSWSYTHWLNGEIELANLSQLATISGLPDTVYHLAGGSSVGVSLQNPNEDFRRTVDTTARLLEWVRLNSPRSKIVCVSSAAVYGSGHSGAIAESVPITPYSPYGFHKAMMEGLCQSYCASFNLQIGIVRLFSIYGPHLEKQLIWDLCCKLAGAGKSGIELGGTGDEFRDWLHVSDAVRLLWIARDGCSRDCRTVNGGTGVGTRISEIANLVRREWGAESAIKFNGQVRAGDPESLVAEVRGARSLGFVPTKSLEAGIRETVEWFKQSRCQQSNA